jgi:hypothetical protein
MSPSLAGHLALLRRHLVPSLCNDAAFGSIAELGRRLPNVRAAGFERVLGNGEGDVDFAIAFRRLHPAGKHFARAPETSGPVTALLEAAGDEGSPLAGAFGVFWLEYDLARGVDRPSLFVGPRGPDRAGVVRRASEIVLGCELAPRVRAELDRIAAPIAGVELFQAGWMLARESPGLRLCFSAGSVAAMQPLLARIPDRHQREAIVECWSRFDAGLTEFVVAMDIGDGHIAARIGLELGFRGWKPSQPIVPWVRLLERLVDAGLCTQAELHALMRWPGRMSENDVDGEWPAHLRGARTLLGPYESVVDRAVHHVKLVIDSGEIRALKAYFGSLQTWRVA